MKHFVILVSALLMACSGNTIAEQPTDIKENKKEQASVVKENKKGQVNELPRDRRIYRFQHKLLPKWIFESQGAFFKDLMKGQKEYMVSVAEEIVDLEFSSKIEIRPVKGRDAVLFVFERPTSTGNCYFAIVERRADGGYMYTTYEKSSFYGDAFVGVVGGWSSEGVHFNMGPREYTEADDFVNDVFGQ